MSSRQDVGGSALRQDAGDGATCSHKAMERGLAATPCASTALAMSGGCRRAASSHTSSLLGQNSQPVFSSCRAWLSLPACSSQHAQ